MKGELEKQTKVLRKVLEDKEKEIVNTKDQLCLAKEEVIQEYRDSDALLAELRNSFADGFDNCFRQMKVSYPDLDLSHISIDPQAKTPAQPIHSESTNELFNDDTITDPQGEEETVLVAQTSAVGDNARLVEGDEKTKYGEN